MNFSRDEFQLEAQFLETALRRAEFLREHESKKANKEYDKLHRLKNKLRELPDKGDSLLKRIVSHSDLDVRILAAAALLAVDEPYAISVLEDVSARDAGLQSFTAEMTLREWRKGSIRDYWA